MSKEAGWTLEDWLALPENARFELIDGELVEKAAPTFDHGGAQLHTASALDGAFGRRTGGPNGPGGWWLRTEVDILLDGRVLRPDITGWRRERLDAPPKDRPVQVRPDWTCEVLSDSNRAHDTVQKLRYYFDAGVPHYWILDQHHRTLTVHRHTPAGYLVVLAAEAHERVRAEPFEAIELLVGVLLGDDPD